MSLKKRKERKILFLRQTIFGKMLRQHILIKSRKIFYKNSQSCQLSASTSHFKTQTKTIYKKKKKHLNQGTSSAVFTMHSMLTSIHTETYRPQDACRALYTNLGQQKVQIKCKNSKRQL